MMAQQLDCKDIINHALYPIDEQNAPARRGIIERIKHELTDDGCSVIRDFFSSAGLASLLEEANQRKPKAYYSQSKECNVYLNDGDAAFGVDHPRNVLLPRTNGFITADLFGPETASHRLYHWQPLKQFLAECLGKDQLYLYEDPVSNMIVNLGRPGQQFNWHFDTNEFTITMLLQPASSGAHFEYVPELRNAQDECYENVRRVLEGDRERVKRLELNAGDLQFFLGRFAMHQVTENTGDIDRLLLIMSFSEQPGMIGSLVRVKNLYGKVTEAHRAAQVRADGLVD
jgi:hypothetical protein